jgi:multidrug efflux pump subunit AcrA (membrane-fusion protein)
MVNTGDFVHPPAGKGEWLFKVARLDPVRVVVEVPEADAGLVREKSEVKLNVQAARGPSLSGTVTRTSWALEPGARTLRVEVDLPNKEGLLRPGMYVHAEITNRLAEDWSLPASALAKQGNETFCFLIEGGKAVRTPVQVGRSDGQHTAVLKLQKPGATPSWVDWTGKEEVAARTTGLSDGQAVQREASAK